MTIKNQLQIGAFERIIDTAQKMLGGKMNLVEGSRLICALRMSIYDPDPDDSIYDIFVMVKVETHDLPLSVKKESKYHTLLVRANQKIEEYASLMKPIILQACSDIIEAMNEKKDYYKRRT